MMPNVSGKKKVVRLSNTMHKIIENWYNNRGRIGFLIHYATRPNDSTYWEKHYCDYVVFNYGQSTTIIFDTY